MSETDKRGSTVNAVDEIREAASNPTPAAKNGKRGPKGAA